jgi:hypothetical protein
MRSSSSRLRTGAAVTAATLALFGFGGSAFAGEKGQGDTHRAANRDAATTSTVTEDTDADGVANNLPDDGDNRHPSGKDRSVEAGGSGDQGHSASTPDQDGHGPERDYQGTDKPGYGGGMDVLDQDRNNGCGNDDDFEDDNEGWCGHHPKPAHPEHPEQATGGSGEGGGGAVAGEQQDHPCAGPMSEHASETAAEAHGHRCADHEGPCTGDMTGSETGTSASEEECGAAAATGGVRTAEGTTAVVAPGAVLGTELQAAGTLALAPAAPTVQTQVLGLEIERGATDTAGTAAERTGGGSSGLGASVLGATLTRGSVLAFTGLSTGVLVLLALALLAAGWLLLRAGRKAHTA